MPIIDIEIVHYNTSSQWELQGILTNVDSLAKLSYKNISSTSNVIKKKHSNIYLSF